MSGAAFTLTTEGQRDIEMRLGALVRAGNELSTLMGDISHYLEQTTIERFDTETAPDGSKWTPSQRAKEEGGKTLTDSAVLRQSQRAIADADSVEVGSNIEYARVHNEGFDGTVKVGVHVRTVRQIFGRPLPGGLSFKVGPFDREMKMPQRQFLGLSSEDEEEILALTDDHFGGGLEGAQP